MRFLPNIRHGTERYPEKIARRLRAMNITAWRVAAMAGGFSLLRFLDPAPGRWQIALINLGERRARSAGRSRRGAGRSRARDAQGAGGPRRSQAPRKRSGYTLTIVRKENGRWRLARDANLMA